MTTFTHYAFQCIRMLARAWMFIETRIDSLADWWDGYWYKNLHHYFVRSDGVEFNQDMDTVPADSLYFEEVGHNKVRVLYEGDAVTPYTHDPNIDVEEPWLWIGHAPSETDLTHTLQKYVVPGNFIMLDLLIHLTGREDTDEGFMYMDANTLQLRKFPVEGIPIKTQDAANTVSNR